MKKLEPKIVELGACLKAKNSTLTCAESCTGGGIAYNLTSVAGSSDWFKQSWVTYSNNAKEFLLGVSHNTLLTYGAVSEQTVIEMVNGAVLNAEANVGVAVSGIAGPGGGSQDKPVGLVWFGFHVHGKTWATPQQFSGDRAKVREDAITYAVQTLHERLVVL